MRAGPTGPGQPMPARCWLTRLRRSVAVGQPRTRPVVDCCAAEPSVWKSKAIVSRCPRAGAGCASPTRSVWNCGAGAAGDAHAVLELTEAHGREVGIEVAHVGRHDPAEEDAAETGCRVDGRRMPMATRRGRIQPEWNTQPARIIAAGYRRHPDLVPAGPPARGRAVRRRSGWCTRRSSGALAGSSPNSATSYSTVPNRPAGSQRYRAAWLRWRRRAVGGQRGTSRPWRCRRRASRRSGRRWRGRRRRSRSPGRPSKSSTRADQYAVARGRRCR